MSVVGYGLDFGTTNSAIAIAHDDSDEAEVLNIAGATDPRLFPSLLYVDRVEQELAGADASKEFMVTGASRTHCQECSLVHTSGLERFTDCRQFTRGGGCPDSRLLSGLKSELANPDFSSTSSWARSYDLTDMLAVIIRDLKRRADRYVRSDVRRVVVGYPFVFRGAEGYDYRGRQQAALDILTAAAERAGFDEVEVLQEPAAAALVEDVETGLVLTTDFGGGTFDVAITEFSEDEARVVAIEGAAVGGDLLDERLFRRYVLPSLGLDAKFQASNGSLLSIPNVVGGNLLSLTRLKHLMNDPWISALLGHLEADGAALPAVRELVYGGQAYSFYSSVEAAKIELSGGAPFAELPLRRLRLDGTVRIDAAGFEAIVTPIINVAQAAIERAIANAGIRVQDLSYVVRTGGSSQLPAFRERLVHMFGEDKVKDRDPFTTVVRGLGISARDRWAS